MNNLLYKYCDQTAVYWGNPQTTATGENSYNPPVEIKVREIQEINLIKDNQGEEIVSNSYVFSLVDLDVGGLLYIGQLTDLDSDQNYQDVDSYEILKTEKIRSLRNNGVEIRKSYLK